MSIFLGFPHWSPEGSAGSLLSRSKHSQCNYPPKAVENSNLGFTRPHYSEILSTSYKKKKIKWPKATGRQFSKEANSNGPQILGKLLAPLLIKEHSFQSDMSLPSDQGKLSATALQLCEHVCQPPSLSAPFFSSSGNAASCQERFLPLLRNMVGCGAAMFSFCHPVAANSQSWAPPANLSGWSGTGP